jgi:hypothetical protein
MSEQVNLIPYPFYDLEILARSPSIEEVMRLDNVVRLVELQITDLVD